MIGVDLPGYGIETAPAGPRVEACLICRADEISLEDGYCAECHWTDEETCSDWQDRVEARRVTK